MKTVTIEHSAAVWAWTTPSVLQSDTTDDNGGDLPVICRYSVRKWKLTLISGANALCSTQTHEVSGTSRWTPQVNELSETRAGDAGRQVSGRSPICAIARSERFRRLSPVSQSVGRRPPSSTVVRHLREHRVLNEISTLACQIYCRCWWLRYTVSGKNQVTIDFWSYRPQM